MGSPKVFGTVSQNPPPGTFFATKHHTITAEHGWKCITGSRQRVWRDVSQSPQAARTRCPLSNEVSRLFTAHALFLRSVLKKIARRQLCIISVGCKSTGSGADEAGEDGGQMCRECRGDIFPGFSKTKKSTNASFG